MLEESVLRCYPGLGKASLAVAGDGGWGCPEYPGSNSRI